MKQPKPIDLNTTVNFVSNQVKKKLEDRKTTIFIVLTAINIFLIGFMLAENKNLTRQVVSLQDKHDTTQVYLNKLRAKNNE